MSLCRCARRISAALVVALILFVLSGAVAVAQQDHPPKVDIFVGYQWLNPGGTVPTIQNLPFQGPQPPVATKLPGMPIGWGASGTYNFTEHWGLTLDVGGNYQDKASESTIAVGPRFMWRTEGLNVFAHTLLGLNRLAPKGIEGKNGIGAVLGGGFDLPVTRALSIRIFEADWVWGHHNFSDIIPPTDPHLQRPSLSGARLRTGLVFNLGGEEPVPPAASCSVQPNEVMVGEPVTLTVSPSNFKPGRTLSYSYSATGGKVQGKDSAATIDTTGLAGGSYTVTARVSDPKQKKNGEASCNASFNVKEPPKNPPTMSCTANPTSGQVGFTSTITCDCKSPDGVPVTVAGWSASAGKVSGEGNSVTLDTTGAPAGPITVNATCTDSRGLTASSSANVTVEVPPPPPPQASKLSECDFPNKVKPWRVDNTCKAILDDVALRLQRESDAKVVIVGQADEVEARKRKNLAAERAVNSKAYLSGGEAKQAIDPSRIEVRTGTAGGQKAEYWIVPAGAAFNEAGTTPVDENKVKAVPDHPRAPARKAKPAAQ